MRETEIDRIVDELEREYSGDAWHGSPLTQILDGIDHVQAGARPIAAGHTIWELVLHVTAWKNEVRRRISGEPAGDPPEGDWPPVPSSQTADVWREAVAALAAAQRALIDAIRRLPEAQLFESTKDPRDRETGAGVSHYVLLHGAVQHDVYHSGQIALLKKSAVRGS